MVRSLLRVARVFTVPQVTLLPSSLLAPSSRYYARTFSDGAGSSSLRHSVVTSLTKTCPSCGAVLPTALPVCPSCSYIARIHDSISYHDMLGLPYEPNPFLVDGAILRRHFLEAQRISHPDAWATKDESQRDVALHVSNAVNAAYKALLSPLHRAEYILQRNGFNTEEMDQLEDLEFISEIMEVREGIETGNVDQIRALENDNDNKIREVHRIIERSVAEKNWEEAKAAAVRLKYLHGISDAIKQRLDDL